MDVATPPSISQLEILKQKADQLFKETNFKESEEQYRKILSNVTTIQNAFAHKEENLHLFLLNVKSNHSAVLLKLEEYQLVCDICTDILVSSKNDNENNRNNAKKAHYRRALALKSLRRLDEALEDVEALLALEPSNCQCQTLRSELRTMGISKSKSDSASSSIPSMNHKDNDGVGEEKEVGNESRVHEDEEEEEEEQKDVASSSGEGFYSFMNPNWVSEQEQLKVKLNNEPITLELRQSHNLSIVPSIGSDSKNENKTFLAASISSNSNIFRSVLHTAKKKGKTGTNGNNALSEGMQRSKKTISNEKAEAALNLLRLEEENAQLNLANTIARTNSYASNKDKGRGKKCDLVRKEATISTSSATATVSASAKVIGTLAHKKIDVGESVVGAWEQMVKEEAQQSHRIHTIIKQKQSRV